MGWLRDKLWAEGHHVTLLRGRLTQAERQRRELTMDGNVGLADTMLRLKEKAGEMVLEQVVLQRE